MESSDVGHLPQWAIDPKLLTLKEQTRLQGVRPIASLNDLAEPGMFDSDEELHEFLADLRSSRGHASHLPSQSEHHRHLAHEEPGSTSFLAPTVVISESEARLLGNRELVEQIKHALDSPASRARPGRPTKQDGADTKH